MISSNLRFISLCRLSIRLFKYSHLSLADVELYITLAGLDAGRFDDIKHGQKDIKIFLSLDKIFANNKVII